MKDQGSKIKAKEANFDLETLILELNQMNRWISLFVILCIAWACADAPPTASAREAEVKPKVKKVTGMERSELALLMREMHDRLQLVSDSLEQGLEVHPGFLEEFKAIHTATATQPSKIDDVYRGMADHFLTNYQRFESSQEDQKATFNSAIDACLSCHQQKCTGPMKIIRRLKVAG